MIKRESALRLLALGMFSVTPALGQFDSGSKGSDGVFDCTVLTATAPVCPADFETLGAGKIPPALDESNFPEPPATALPPHSLEGLNSLQGDLLRRLARSGTAAHAPVPVLCFAPGTPPDVVSAAYEALRNRRSDGGDIDLFQFPDGNRWSTTARSGGGLVQGDPTVLTWSYVPDGTFIDGFGPEPPSNSNFYSWMNGIYGGFATWHALFVQVFERWSELTGNTYVYEANDDGAPIASVSGVVGVRGDVRIGGHLIDGNSGVLAYNFYPNNGDMVFDSADAFYTDTSSNSLHLRNVAAHEHGHGIGIRHVCPMTQTKLMEPFFTSTFDGPRHDDILAGNRGYGDPLEDNDTSATASDLGAIGVGNTVTVQGVSIDDNADADWYGATLSSGARISVRLTPIGSIYLNGPQNSDGSCSPGTPFNSLAQSNLGVEVRAPNGTTVRATADDNPAGSPETIVDLDLVDGAGTYFVRVFGAANAAQMYELEVSHVGPAIPPNDLCPNAICVADGVPINGSNVNASGSGGTGCDTGFPVDVWYHYTPTASETVTISLCGGASFDTILSVHDVCNGGLWACDDDGCGTAQSELSLGMTAGTTYLIRVDGFAEESGPFVLTVTGGGGTCDPGCDPPPAPVNPDPPDGTGNAPADTDLAWNGSLGAVLTTSATDPGSPRPKDERRATVSGVVRDQGQWQNRATVAGRGFRSVPAVERDGALGNGIVEADESVGRRDEMRRSWPAWFRVAAATVCDFDAIPDSVVGSSYPGVTFDIAGVTGTAVVYPADGATGGVTTSLPNVAGGSPSGLPLGGVFDELQTQVGMYFGNDDYGYTGDVVLTVYSDTGATVPVASTTVAANGNDYCDQFIGLDVPVGVRSWTLDFMASPSLTRCIDDFTFGGRCPTTFDVYFGTNPGAMGLICDNVAEPACDPGVLAEGTTYFWQVVATDCCGSTPSAVWSFTTSRDGGCRSLIGQEVRFQCPECGPSLDETFTVLEGVPELTPFDQFQVDVEADTLRIDWLINSTAIIDPLHFILSWDPAILGISRAFLDPSSTLNVAVTFTSVSVTLDVGGVDVTTSDFIVVNLVCAGGECAGAPDGTPCADDTDTCTEDVCISDVCNHLPISVCTDGDGCCPAGCTWVSDNDCPAELLVRLTPVVLQNPSGSEVTVGSPPAGDPETLQGYPFFVELWAQQVDPNLAGLQCVFSDLSFDGSVMTCVGTAPSPSFNVLATGACTPGGVDELGGCGFSTGVGIIPEWVLVATVEMTADVESLGNVVVSDAAATSISISSFGNVPVALIDFVNAQPFDIVASCIYNLDGVMDCPQLECPPGVPCIDPGDFAFFVPCWLTCNDDPGWAGNNCDAADFDCSGCVDPGDFAFFAPSWLTCCDDPSIVTPPCRSSSGVALPPADRATVESFGLPYPDASDPRFKRVPETMNDVDATPILDYRHGAQGVRSADPKVRR